MAKKRDPGEGITIHRFVNVNADNAAIMNNLLKRLYGERDMVYFKEKRQNIEPHYREVSF